MKRENILTIISFILIGISCFYLGYNTKDVFISKDIEINYNYSNCSNLDLFMTSECLNKQLKEFFYYNFSNMGKELTLEEFKEQGGVCTHASKWYYDNIDNFYKTQVVIDVNETMTHIFTIISNDDGYCILDQQINKCINF